MDPRTEQQIDRLEATVAELVEQHEGMLALIERKREAMRDGDVQRMNELARRENERIQTISELEKKRLEQAGQLTLLLRPQASEPLRMAELAELLPEPQRGRLLVARQGLLEKMKQVQHQNSVARRAADSLVKHVTGLLTTINAVSTGAVTYGSNGAAPGASAAIRTINLTA